MRGLLAFVVSFVTLATGARAMPQEPAATAGQLQEQIDAIKKQTDLLEAQKKLLEAQKALTDAQKPSTNAEEIATAKAAREMADAQKALLDSKKAQSEAELAAFKASLGEVPSSGISGAVDAKENAGELEAALLAMKAIEEIAGTISGRVRKLAADGSRIVVVAAAEVPSFSSLIAYDTEVAVVREVLKGAIAAAAPKTEAPGAKPEAVPLLGAAGVALDATSKLLSFFKSDFVVKGVTLELPDSVALNAVADELARPAQAGNGTAFEVRVPTIYDPAMLASAADFFIKDIGELSKLRGEAQTLVTQGSAQLADLKKAFDAASDTTTKAAFEQQLALKTKLVSGLQSAIALMDAWYTKLGTPDSKGVSALVTVAREKAIAGSIGEGLLLVVKVQKAGGGVMTKKNLWTFFGGMPLYHMGGAAVTFTLIDGKTGVVKASGVIPVHGGFVKAGDLRKVLGS
jgi:hypothetical protein